jgi:DNA-binding transcriptional LysR family regulator
MDTIRSMRVFTRAVELGSLSAVARETGATQPTISKIVAGLEAELGARLLTRTTTTLAPTEAGERFYRRARELLEAFDEAAADVKGSQERPEGRLRIAAPVSFGVLHLNPLVHEFMARHPGIEVDLVLNDRYVDPIAEGVDVALRIGRDLPPDVVARPVAVSRRRIVGAPALLREGPKIRRPDDLSKHAYLFYASTANALPLELLHRDGRTVRVEVNGRYRINNSLAIRESLLAGAGVTLAPDWLVGDLLEQGRLEAVLPAWSARPHELCLLYPPGRYRPARARLFIEFLEARLAQADGLYWNAIEKSPRNEAGLSRAASLSR